MTQKHALVTGASEGIGRAFATRLAREGYTVTVSGRNQARLDSLLGELTGRAHQAVVADLSTSVGVKSVADMLGKLPYDLLVNNAGAGLYGSFHTLALDKQLDILRLNCEALVSLAHAYLGAARSGDALINTSSALAFLPMPSAAVYAATKAMVTSLSEALWYENKDRGVYVMGLCPGITESEFAKRAGGQTKTPAILTQTADQVVDVALEALRARHAPTVVCGEVNMAMTSLTRLMPRKAIVTLMGNARPS